MMTDYLVMGFVRDCMPNSGTLDDPPHLPSGTFVRLSGKSALVKVAALEKVLAEALSRASFSPDTSDRDVLKQLMRNMPASQVEWGGRSWGRRGERGRKGRVGMWWRG